MRNVAQDAAKAKNKKAALGTDVVIENFTQEDINAFDVIDDLKDVDLKEFTCVRPGHADFAGALKYNQTDVRNILERSSARETAIKVAVGSIAKQILKKFNIKLSFYFCWCFSCCFSCCHSFLLDCNQTVISSFPLR